jgi:REP element-mobilizing transposase RayT
MAAISVLRKMVELDYYVIMTNHLHGIIIINGEESVETNRDASLRIVKNNLSDIIRGFKGYCTKRIHITGDSSFSWQARFYDHIIRNEKDLHRIRTYIQNNH